MHQLTDESRATFERAWTTIARHVHRNAITHGFWPDDKSQRSDGEAIALAHSELSEALQGIREGNPPDEHCPELSSAEIELADCVIRIMDHARARNWDIGRAIIAKARFNESRPYKHGKEF